MGRAPLDIACKLILKKVFNLNAVNVDGSYDGGSDFATFTQNGRKETVAYQVTTQKSQLEAKAYRDAETAIKKLGANRFFFFTSINIKPARAKIIENDITRDLGIAATCIPSAQIAGLILESNLLNEFLDLANYPLPRGIAKIPDLQEVALHGIPLLSSDSRVARESVYDDTILLVASGKALPDEDLVSDVIKFLNLTHERKNVISNRLGSLFGNELLSRNADRHVVLSQSGINRLKAQEQLYQSELDDLVSAQTDLMQRDYGARWSVENSRQIGLLIAHIYITSQLSVLRKTKPSVSLNPILNIRECTVTDIKSFLLKENLVASTAVDSATFALLSLSSHHPLIVKLARASICLALEGRNPLAASKALGSPRWSDYSILVEPSVAIPFLCDTLYVGDRNASFAASVDAIKRAKELNARCFITYYYINECAGHLLRARKYGDLSLDERELAYSPNAFVSNYYSLKGSNKRLPATFFEYLKTFSPAIAIPRPDIRDWTRAIMTDLQSLLNRGGIAFVEAPFYDHNVCSEIEKEYSYFLDSHRRTKPKHLTDHDVWALQFTHDRKKKEGEHWLILTYDRGMAHVGAKDTYSGWIASPPTFIDLTESTLPLPDARYIDVVHRIASFSERSLSAGARILDRIIHFASNEMQNWEFQAEVQRFKESAIKGSDFGTPDAFDELDDLTDAFLRAKGVEVQHNGPEDEIVDAPPQ